MSSCHAARGRKRARKEEPQTEKSCAEEEDLQRYGLTKYEIETFRRLPGIDFSNRQIASIVAEEIDIRIATHEFYELESLLCMVANSVVNGIMPLLYQTGIVSRVSSLARGTLKKKAPGP